MAKGFVLPTACGAPFLLDSGEFCRCRARFHSSSESTFLHSTRPVKMVLVPGARAHGSRRIASKSMSLNVYWFQQTWSHSSKRFRVCFAASGLSAVGEMSNMRSRRSQKAKPRALAFPLRALIERIDANEDPPWASYMSPAIVRAERAAQPKEELPRLLGSRPEQNDPHCCREISLAGRVWELSQDSKGCREVQLAIEEASDDVRRGLLAEIAGHVLDAMRCPHANHVLQKCITCSRPEVEASTYVRVWMVKIQGNCYFHSHTRL